MRTLLVYNEVPEKLRVYAFDADDEQEELLRRCHGKYVNGDMSSEDVEALVALVEKLEPYEVYNDEKQLPVAAFGGHVLIVTGFIV